MALTMPKNEGGNYSYEPCPEGNHVCVCCAIIDLGTQEVVYKNDPPKMQRKVYIGWEITGETKEDGTPFYIGNRYTYSSHEKSALRKMIESWRGKKFTDDELGVFLIKNLLGVGCMINIVRTEPNSEGKSYANIASIAKLPKGMKSAQPTDPPVYFSLEEDEFDLAVFGELSEKMQDVIKKSPEFTQRVRGESPTENLESKSGIEAEYAGDDIPF